MSSLIPRRILPALALMAALALPHPAQAATVRHSSLGMAVLEGLPGSLWSWTVRAWSGIVQKNGAQTDPNGSTVPTGTTNDNGAQVDPDGSTSDNGAQIDPDG